MAADRTEPIRNSGSTSNLSLDELVALTDEMAALVRAGVPLEKGLAQAAADLRRRPGKVAADVALRMQAGESLPHVMANSPETFPPVYSAVVEAGLRSGRLPAALEALAGSSRRIAELRRLSRMAMLYPALVAFLAFGLFVCGAVWFQPRVTQTYEVMGVPAAPLNLLLAELGRTAPLWAPWIPLVALVALAWWWYRSSRATARPPRWWHLAPAKRLLYYSRLATFADLLALLIEHGTPLGEAVVLAADAGGDKRLRLSAREFARLVSAGIKPNFAAAEVNPQVSSGAESTSAVPQLSGFPPLVSSLLVGGGNQAALVVALRNMAEAYHRRVERLDDWLRMYLPLSLVIAIGGTAVMIYALTLLGPWYQMLTHIGSTLR